MIVIIIIIFAAAIWSLILAAGIIGTIKSWKKIYEAGRDE